MFLKRSKDWRYPEGDRSVKVPYYNYRIAEKVPGPDGKSHTETVLALAGLPVLRVAVINISTIYVLNINDNSNL